MVIHSAGRPEYKGPKGKAMTWTKANPALKHDDAATGLLLQAGNATVQLIKSDGKYFVRCEPFFTAWYQLVSADLHAAKIEAVERVLEKMRLAAEVLEQNRA